MKQWHIQQGSRVDGPHGLESLKHLFKVGVITKESFVSEVGSNSWIKLREIPEYLPELLGAKSYAPKQEPNIPTSSPEVFHRPGYWARFFARSFDMSLISIPVITISSIYAADIFPGIAELLSTQQGLYKYSIAAMPVVLLVEALLQFFFGNTPGKWLLGIHIIGSISNPPTLRKQIARSILVWIIGLGGCIPILNFIPMYVQYRIILNGRRATYDKILDLDVIWRKPAWWKLAIFMALFLATWAFHGLINSINKINLRDNDSSAIIWVNPNTKKQVALPIGQDWDTLTSDSEMLELTERSTDRNIVHWTSTKDNRTFLQFVDAQISAVEENYHLDNPGVLIGHKGVQSWKMHGHSINNPARKVRVIIKEDLKFFWGFAEFNTLGPKTRDTTLLNRIIDSLWTTRE